MRRGEVRERLKRAASKAAIPERVSGVRIPPSPPVIPLSGPETVRLSSKRLLAPCRHQATISSSFCDFWVLSQLALKVSPVRPWTSDA